MIKSKQLSLSGLLINILFSENPGKKETVIFLHGWRSSSAAWFKVLTGISEAGFSVYAIDLPGFGESETPPADFNLEKYASVVKEFITKERIMETGPKAVIVGHSFGGRVALKFASLYPDAVSKLVLVDSAGLKYGNKKSFLRFLAKIFKPFFKFPPLRSLRPSIYKRIGAEDYLATPELKSVFLSIIKEDLSPVLPAINIPTLIVWGEDDKTTPLDSAYVFKEKIKNSEISVIKDAGHFPFLDQPNKFSEILLNFLK